MTNEEFFRLIAKTTKKNRIIGMVFTLVATFGFAGIVIKGTGTVTTGGVIALYVLLGLILLIGIFTVVKSAQAASQIKNGKHPLIQAILSGDTSFVVWFYQQITTTKNVDADIAAAHQIWVCDRNNKHTIISVKGRQASDVLNYLAGKFPNALMGYSKENQQEYKSRVS